MTTGAGSGPGAVAPHRAAFLSHLPHCAAMSPGAHRRASGAAARVARFIALPCDGEQAREADEPALFGTLLAVVL
jgi:hypothetical protein